MSIHESVQGLEELTAALGKMGPELNKEKRRAISKAMTIMQDEARRLIHSPTGHASKGIVQKIVFSSTTVQGKLQPGARPNGLAMIFSQRSTGPDRTPPPVSAIARLAKSWGINPYALAKSIGKKGTKGHAVMRSAYKAKKADTIAAFKSGLEAVVHLAHR